MCKFKCSPFHLIWSMLSSADLTSLRQADIFLFNAQSCHLPWFSFCKKRVTQAVLQDNHEHGLEYVIYQKFTCLFTESPHRHCSSENLLQAVFIDMFHSNSLPYLQRSISMDAAGVYLIADLYWDRQLMGTVASPEVCLYSRSHFHYSCDILTTPEVSQLFQGINNGSGSPYLTFTVQAAYFVVVVFYLSGYQEKVSNELSFLSATLFSPFSWFRGVFEGGASIWYAFASVKFIFFFPIPSGGDGKIHNKPFQKHWFPVMWPGNFQEQH